ncbi:hypothetical protein K2Y11_01910 [bacterium]|nr:hypothetical protein [bacterium]
MCSGFAIILGLYPIKTFAGSPILDPAKPMPAQLQQILDQAEPDSIVDFDLRGYVEVNTTLRINKPLWIRGLRLKLPAGLARTPLLVTHVAGVRVTDSYFRGNGDTVDQAVRASLLDIHASDFRVERCVFENSAKNGLTIDPDNSGQPIVGGVIRDIVGYHVIRDVVSLSGGPGDGVIRDVLVENVRAYDSKLRGAVEVSDGAADITVRSVTSERCVYAVDVQDHGEPHEINRNILLEDIRARRCRHAIRTANDPHGHEGLAIRNVVAEDCELPLRISHTKDVIIEGVRIIRRQLDPTESKHSNNMLQIKSCQNVSLRDLTFRDCGKLTAAVELIDSGDVRIDGMLVSGPTSIDHAILEVARAQKPGASVILQNIRAPAARHPVTRQVDTNLPPAENDKKKQR